MNTQGSIALSVYRKDLGQRKILTAETERELAMRWRAGDREAGRQMIEACLSFVLTIALEYRRWGVPLEDLVQEGNVGLLKAAARFDPDRGTRLASYAAFWIRAEIREHVARGYRIVGLGGSKAERRALRLYRKTREQDPRELAKMSGLSEERARDLLPVLMASDLSLDDAPFEGGAPIDRLADSARSPEEEVSLADERERLERAIERVVGELSPRERRIVVERLMADDSTTLEELGTAFGVSKERVRQIEIGAKKRMRERLTQIRAVTA